MRLILESVYRTFEGANTTVIQGDAVEVLDREVTDGSVDLIFADPPYNFGKRFAQFVNQWPSDVEYAKWCESWLAVVRYRATQFGEERFSANDDCCLDSTGCYETPNGVFLDSASTKVIRRRDRAIASLH